MAFSISLPDSLREFLEKEMRERGHESLDACVACLLARAEKRKPPRRTFTVEGQTYGLTRLNDRQDYELHESTIAIKLDAHFAFSLALRRDGLNLAETYAVCRHLFGERGKGFDDWKGDFAFPFALDVPRADRRPAYVFRVVNVRGGVEYDLRKLVDPTDKRLKDPIYYPPDASEFSREEIEEFLSYFIGFLKGYFESFAVVWKDRFLLAVQSNLILYGFDGDKFFTQDFNSARKFAKTRAELSKTLPTPGFYVSAGES